MPHVVTVSRVERNIVSTYFISAMLVALTFPTVADDYVSSVYSESVKVNREELYSTSLHGLRMAVNERIDSVIDAYARVAEEFAGNKKIEKYSQARIASWKLARDIELRELNDIEGIIEEGDRLYFYKRDDVSRIEEGIAIVAGDGSVKKRYVRMTVSRPEAGGEGPSPNGSSLQIPELNDRR